MRSSDVTASIARQWAEAWTSGDLDRVAALLADGVTVEHNLGQAAESSQLLESIRVLAGALEGAPVLSLTTTDRRAAVLYDCRIGGPSGNLRLAEFLDLDQERIVGVRRVYDLTAVDRLLPRLRDCAAS